MCRTQIQQQFVSGWKPADGSELPQQWIDLDNSSNVPSDKGKNRKCTKFLSEFPQAKFQMTHCKSRKLDDAKSKTCKPMENMCQDVKSDTITVPNKRKLILKRTELPLIWEISY